MATRDVLRNVVDSIVVPVDSVFVKNSGVTDPYFANVSLLLHGNGTNGSTTFTDNSSNALTTTLFGSAQISTAQSKFGGGSMLFNGSTAYATVPDSALFDLQGIAYTMELQFYVTALPGLECILLSQNNYGTSGEWDIRIKSNGTVVYSIGPAGTAAITSSVVSTGSFYHLAVLDDGTQSLMFLNGVSQGTNSSLRYLNSTKAFSIGAASNATAKFNGYIDELRVTKGVARYTTNFTAPTAEFPNS